MKQGFGTGIVLLIALATGACKREPSGPEMAEGTKVDGSPSVIDLDQGWSHADQDGASFASFGSRMVPKAWLLHLENADGSPFVGEKGMGALGFLLQAAPSAGNPDALPVGITVARDATGREWAGLGCAACHTGQVDFRGTHMRIDGGQALIDFDAFEQATIDALERALADRGRFLRFADAIGTPEGRREPLRAEMTALRDKLAARHALNAAPVPYGHGRLDAFGQIFNAVTVEFLGVPGNKHVPDAPVSYPVMWDASHLDLVQWNGSAPNAGPGPLLQNVTTALAVYGSLEVAGHDGLAGFPSSVDFHKLGDIQDWFYKLKSPAWPEPVLGKLDGERVARGSAIYARECLGCHALSDRNDPKRQLKATLTPLAQVATDPRMVRNFLDARVSSGPWKGRKAAILAGPELGEQAQSIDMVAHAAIGATLRHPLSAVRDAAVSWHTVYKAGIAQHPDYYKARPLSGIWASAPYLHNGSVPTLAELLKPSAQRVPKFWVGGREFDPEAVGNESGEGPNRSLLDTSLPGNSNAGHEFGTALPDQDKRDLLEYLKSL
jgi:mono/diheme cytochrome c family protein